jgi:hypothetical protein
MLPDNFKVVMLSRRRHETIAKHTLKLMPWALVTVEEEEVDAYAEVMPREQIVPHPKFEANAHIRNWIFDTWPDTEFLITVHDDLHKLRCLVGWRARTYRDPDLVAELLHNTAICARDAGAHLFGFGNHAGGTVHYQKHAPFRLNGYVRNVIGHVRGHGLRWDPEMKGHFDVDFGLQSLMRHRIIWRDERWVFDDAPLASNAGGFSGIRTQAWLDEGRANMMEKWGPRYLRFVARHDRRKGTSRTEASMIRVPRRDPRIRA